MSFSTRQTTDLDGIFESVVSREGEIFSETVTLRKEDNTTSTIYIIQTDYYGEYGDSQERTFRMRSAEGPVVRGDRIEQTVDGSTIHWTVRDVKNDQLGLLNVRCSTPIAKG